MTAKYLNPYTDFGFKKLFGEEGSKDLLMDFLNQLLPAHHQVATLQFNNSEQLNETPAERIVSIQPPNFHILQQVINARNNFKNIDSLVSY